MKTLRHCLAAMLLLSLATICLAQPATQPPPAPPEPLAILQGRPDVPAEAMLGGSYQNPLAGIAFRVPGSCQQVAKAGDEIARFANDAKTWELVVGKTTSAQPMPLTGGEGRDAKMGLLEVIVGRLKTTSPSIEILRQDVVNLGEHHAGIIAARLSVGSQRKLLQEAIVQANDQLYYTFVFTTPAAKDAAGTDSADPGEKVAFETFSRMLDTIKLLDGSQIRGDQDERLFRTRSLFVNLNEKSLTAVLVPEQWLRLLHDGKDIGYTYLVEETGVQGPNEGVKIGIRSRSYPEATVQVDGETWYFISFDRRHEAWSNLAWVQNPQAKTSDQFTEIGSSDRRTKRSADKTGQMEVGEGADEKQPAVVTTETYSLEVQTLGKAKSGEPLRQQLPPWYLPQALGHLLPRLLPVSEPKGFMFAVYVSERGGVMHRYVDVGTEQDVDLGGKRVRAVPITDRLGLEGKPTIHYVSADGKYLGSVNKESKITILPSDAASLQKIWENRADLTRPRDVPQAK